MDPLLPQEKSWERAVYGSTRLLDDQTISQDKMSDLKTIFLKTVSLNLLLISLSIKNN